MKKETCSLRLDPIINPTPNSEQCLSRQFQIRKLWQDAKRPGEGKQIPHSHNISEFGIAGNLGFCSSYKILQMRIMSKKRLNPSFFTLFGVGKNN